jgi:hypothetical protein
VLYFTDNGWTGSQYRGVSSSSPSSSEDILKFTAKTTLAAGTFINTADISIAVEFGRGGIFDDLSLGSSDQINVFTSSFPSNPSLTGYTNLFALTTAGSFLDATTSSTGGIPTGLTQGSTAVATDLGGGMFQYTGPANLLPPKPTYELEPYHLTQQLPHPRARHGRSNAPRLADAAPTTQRLIATQKSHQAGAEHCAAPDFCSTQRKPSGAALHSAPA